MGNQVTLKDIYDNINNLRKEIKEEYVSKTEFRPVKTFVYGLVGMILVVVMTIILNRNIQAKDFADLLR